MPVQEYRKTQTIKGLVWTGENREEVKEFLGGDLLGFDGCGGVSIATNTAEGAQTAVTGDLIARGAKGEHYPIPAAAFEASYELV